MTDALRPAADFLSRRSVPDPQAPTVRPRRTCLSGMCPGQSQILR